jgi:hypothetical protein
VSTPAVDPPFFVIVVENVDDTQRVLIHEAVKEVAQDWWHQMGNVWIVQGLQRAGDWRDLLKPFVPLPPATLLVLRLPQMTQRSWATAFRKGDNGGVWLKEKYMGQAKT